MRRHALILLPATVFALVTMGACGSSTGTPAATSSVTTAHPTSSPGNTENATITIKNFAYTMPDSISPGR